MRTDGGAAGREETLPCLSWTWLVLGWLLKKSLSPHSRAKSSDISSLGTRSRPLLKSQQGANSQSSTRVKTVNRGKHAGERKFREWEKFHSAEHKYSFYFLISLTCPLQTCRYLWSEYCLDAIPERLFILTRLNLCIKRIVWEDKSRYAVNKILSLSYHIIRTEVPNYQRRY